MRATRGASVIASVTVQSRQCAPREARRDRFVREAPMSLLALLALIAIALGIYCLVRGQVVAGIILVIVGLVILGGGISIDG